MKKKFLLTVAVILLSTLYTSAQESTFNQNDNVVNLGIGFGGNLYSGAWYRDSDYSRKPVLTLSYERCIIGNLFNEQSAIGIGGLVGYTSAKYGNSTYGWTSTDIMIGARGAFHYAFVDNLDTYAGIMAGYNVNTWKWHGTWDNSRSSASSGLTYTAFAGARYYFANSIAVFAELGYGYNVINAGISLKF